MQYVIEVGVFYETGARVQYMLIQFKLEMGRYIEIFLSFTERHGATLVGLKIISKCVFTAQCTLVQSAVLRSHVVRLSVRRSVRPSVTLVICDHIG